MPKISPGGGALVPMGSADPLPALVFAPKTVSPGIGTAMELRISFRAITSRISSAVSILNFSFRVGNPDCDFA
jgi:hypothetical protein